MPDTTPWWWHEAIEIFNALIQLLAQRHTEAMVNGAIDNAVRYAEAWIELIHGPWLEGTVKPKQRVPDELGDALTDELLARLQELSLDPDSRLAIALARQRLDGIPPLRWRRLPSPSEDD